MIPLPREVYSSKGASLDFSMRKKSFRAIRRRMVLGVARDDLEVRFAGGDLRSISQVEAGFTYEIGKLREVSGEEFQAVMRKRHVNYATGTYGDRPKIIVRGQDRMLFHSHSPRARS